MVISLIQTVEDVNKVLRREAEDDERPGILNTITMREVAIFCFAYRLDDVMTFFPFFAHEWRIKLLNFEQKR